MTRDQALRDGIAKFDGESCRYGHPGKRYAKHNACCECKRIRAAEARLRDRIADERAALTRKRHQQSVEKRAEEAIGRRLPVAQSDFIRPLTRAELMARRA